MLTNIEAKDTCADGRGLLRLAPSRRTTVPAYPIQRSKDVSSAALLGTMAPVGTRSDQMDTAATHAEARTSRRAERPAGPVELDEAAGDAEIERGLVPRHGVDVGACLSGDDGDVRA